MRYLTLNEVLELYRRIMEQSSGAVGIQSLDVLESALAGFSPAYMGTVGGFSR